MNEPCNEHFIDTGSLERFVFSIPMPAFLVDRAGSIKGWNPLMEKLTSAVSHMAFDRQYRDFVKFTGSGGKCHEGSYKAEECIKSQESAALEGIFLSSLEGRRIPVTFSALPVRAGSTDFCLYMVTDHTLSRDMNTFRKEFISLISHDLKNPVSMIATYGELLKAGAETRPGDERLFLEQILLASSILSIQINNIVNAARLLNGILTFDSSFVDLGQVVVDTVNLIDPQGRARETGFTRVVDDSLWVHGDTMKLQEVIINLLSNAVRYSPKGSTILVEALKKGGTVQFAVTDKGKGLAMDELQVYCQPFQKGRGERSGAGLGLFIATEYLKAHTTELNIESRPGEGCKASFSLPLSPPDGLEGEP